MKIKPNKTKARHAVYKAIKKGDLKREPCEVCGEEKTEAHHTDYSKPLAVMWLCTPHHHEWHKEHGFPDGEADFKAIMVHESVKQMFDSRRGDKKANDYLLELMSK